MSTGYTAKHRIFSHAHVLIQLRGCEVARLRLPLRWLGRFSTLCAWRSGWIQGSVGVEVAGWIWESLLFIRFLSAVGSRFSNVQQPSACREGLQDTRWVCSPQHSRREGLTYFSV